MVDRGFEGYILNALQGNLQKPLRPTKGPNAGKKYIKANAILGYGVSENLEDSVASHFKKVDSTDGYSMLWKMNEANVVVTAYQKVNVIARAI